jgi:hypothetical protein
LPAEGRVPGRDRHVASLQLLTIVWDAVCGL